MRFYLLSDNVDTLIGLRLAGIDVVHEKEEVIKRLRSLCEERDIAVVLMTEKLIKLCPDFVFDIKLNRKQPLIVEIPDRHGAGRTGDTITQYIRDAIGIKL